MYNVNIYINAKANLQIKYQHPIIKNVFFSHINYFIPTFDIFGLGYNFGFGKSFGFFSLSRSKFFMFDSPVLLSLPKICVNISFISNTNYFVGLSLYTRLLFSVFIRDSNLTSTNVSLSVCPSVTKHHVEKSYKQQSPVIQSSMPVMPPPLYDS